MARMTLDAQVEAQWPVMKRIDLRVDRLTVPAIPGALARGTLQISTTAVSALHFEGLASSMTLTGQFLTASERMEEHGRNDRTVFA